MVKARRVDRYSSSVASLIPLEWVAVFRGGTDNKGNAWKVPVGQVEVAFDWGGVSRSQGDFGRQESASMSPKMFVPKGSDVLARDRVQRENGERFVVVGPSLWGQSEFSVFGLCWVVFQLELMNG